MYWGELWLLLMFVHYVFDFCLQTEFMSKYKQKLPVVMTVHVFVWTMAILITLKLLGLFVYAKHFWIPAFLYLGHYLADDIKCDLINMPKYKRSNEEDEKKRMINLFHLDQVWHIIQVSIVTYFVL